MTVQEIADDFRERLAFRHQRIAKRHAAKRDHWRWQIDRHWSELIPRWLPWAALAVFWVATAWVLG